MRRGTPSRLAAQRRVNDPGQSTPSATLKERFACRASCRRCWRSNPVPWARAQMAFTLAFHIILVPLGVSWAFMALVANYRGDQHGRRRRAAAGAAVVEVHGGHVRGRCGDRHRVHVRVRPAVAEVHGPWGAAFGVPFAIEGLFFFTEAIFIAIYIYGWRRLRPWPHFWTGVPIVIAGIGGTISVVAATRG